MHEIEPQADVDFSRTSNVVYVIHVHCMLLTESIIKWVEAMAVILPVLSYC